MRCDSDVSTSGSTSLAKPGSMPFTCSEALPAAAALVSFSSMSSGMTPYGYCRNTGPLDTTLMPAARNSSKRSSAPNGSASVIAVCTMQSGSRASSAALSCVAITPIGLGAADLADVLAVLGVAGDPHPDELQVGAGEDARRSRACRPCRSTTRRCAASSLMRRPPMTCRSAVRSGRPRSRLGWSRPPSTSTTLPVT